MKHISILSLLVLLFSGSLSAGRITGVIKDDKGQVLPFASIMIKGTSKGTTANNEGRYFMVLDSGQHTILCQYVGYTRQEKAITVTSDAMELNFTLRLLQDEMAAVVVKVGAVDPAYAIIKEAIKKRGFYLNQVDRYQSDVYIKGQLRLRDYPNKLFGKKVDFEDGDTSKQKVVYLSETYARLSFKKPSTTKIEVLSTRVSGNSDGFGFSSPQIVNFYNNIVKIGPNPTQRGFVSPIAANALNFYKYKLEGSFIEDGHEVNKIRVTPKRKYEPLFSGYINIVEDDWRIHSMQLILSKQSQIEFMDTVKIEQLHAPLEKDIWVIKTQVIYPSIKMMGFDAYGNFANVYSKYVINPEFGPKYFNNTVMKFNEGSNKNPSAYWDSIRPIPLQDDEIRDYQVKDSLEQARKDPAYQDSIDRIRNKIGFFDIVFTGITIGKEKRRETYRINPLAKSLGYNTAEGVVVNLRGTWSKQLDSTGFNRNLSLTPVLRYGFSNTHFNAYLIGTYNYGARVKNSLSISGGKRVYQFNNENPILDLNNVLSTLYWEKNHLKNYEAWFGKIAYSKSFPRGLNLFGNASIQDRMPLNNTTDWKIRDLPDREYTPNYPENMLTNIVRHQSLTVTVGASWRPGAKYVEFPDRMVYMGSKYPVFTGSITQGVKDLLGSDVDFTKWRFGVSDNLNLKLKGTFSYKFTVGGFLRANSVPVPDYNHFNGNQILTASDYLNSFQLLPYYKYSNTSKFFGEGHVEHHFNGLLTNKIPVFRKLNWHLVAGSNAFILNQNQYYIEAFAGLENIFKLVRVDLVWGFEPQGRSLAGIRVGIRGLGGRDAD
ncbi:MAG: carboxypeptidase-like regulatory domain-containing protein [Chitinophagaceae bacterium]|nr:MAG: carboxypeptidase-like regulatory domain-containing protein [Chitinophagaceae bacterium]